MSLKLVLSAVSAAVLGVGLVMTAGINDAGNRTVVQYPNGTLLVKFTPGYYLKWFGESTTYRDVITFDYDKGVPDGYSSLDQQGIAVRYQDGGTGTIYGKVRFSLPNDEGTMLSLHKAFRSNDGVGNKLLKAVTEESMNLTAGLMSSEAAYAEKRGTFTQWAEMQIKGGKFKTELTQVRTQDEVTGKYVTKNIPEISFGEDGLPIQYVSDFTAYGINVTGFQVTDWNFETTTLTQISEKRKQTMKIITAKATAEAAKQEAITAEEQGKANVMTAQYTEEVEKIKQVVIAEREAEVAVIAAKQQVDVAAQNKLQAEQKKLAAVEYKEEQILIGEGDGERKRLVFEADGALQQKLETYENVNALYADAVSKQKWVPEVQMGATTSGGEGSAAMTLIDMLNVKTAKDLSLDMSLPK